MRKPHVLRSFGIYARHRRVVAKAEHIDGKENPRFVVTSLSSEPPRGQNASKTAR